MSEYKHVPMRPVEFKLLREFARALDTSYTDAFVLLLNLAKKPGETPKQAGERLAKELETV